MVSDPQLPAAELLLGPDVLELLSHATGGRGTVQQAQPMFVDYSPGESIYVAYEAFVEWPTHGSPETLAAMARVDGEVKGTELVEAAGTQIGVWRVPEDPYLPGLARAHDPVFVRELVEQLGLGGGKLVIEPLGYTPRSRSVIKVSREPVGGGLKFAPGQGFRKPEPEPILFLKAMRPHRAAQLRQSHELLEGVIPAARCVVHLEDIGLMGFAPLPGVTLFECIAGETHRPLDGDELIELLDRIADVPVDKGSRLTATRSARLNAETMAAVLPAQAERLESFIERLGDDRPQPEITVHGDFHEEQLLLGPIGLTGVLDLDDTGRGQRIDDLAMMLGRLYAFSETIDYGREKVARYTWSLLEAWERRVDPLELRRRMAAVALNHALMPFRWQEYGWRSETAAGIARADTLLRQLMASDMVPGPTLARP